MKRALLAILCGAALALLPVTAAADAPDLDDGCHKVPCPYLHLFAVCTGGPGELPSLVIGNDTTDCR